MGRSEEATIKEGMAEAKEADARTENSQMVQHTYRWNQHAGPRNFVELEEVRRFSSTV